MSNYLIVGGTSGIGAAAATRLAEQGHGVWVFSRNGDKTPSGATHIAGDIVLETPDFSALPDALDGLMYCPGSILLKPFQSLKEDDFVNDYLINVVGAVKAIKGALPRLKKAEAGASVVLFSSVAAGAGMPFHASIAAAKGAIEGLTRSLAAELAPKIRVNAIAPSLTDTPMAAALLNNDQKREAAMKRHPMQRYGTAEEVAGAAVWLLSAETSWITGQIIHLDGGMSAIRG